MDIPKMCILFFIFLLFHFTFAGLPENFILHPLSYFYLGMFVLLTLIQENIVYIKENANRAYNTHTGGFQFIARDVLFEGFYNTGGTAGPYDNEVSNDKRGGAFHICYREQGDGIAYVYVENCIFHECQSDQDGAICVENFPKGSHFVIRKSCAANSYAKIQEFNFAYVTGDTECNFTSIIACNQENGAKNSDGTMGFAKSNFINLNNMNISDNIGSVILFVTNDDTTKLNAKYLHFQRNKVNYQGIVSQNNIPFTIEYSNFINNNESPDGTCVIYAKAASTIKHSVFDGNSGKNIQIDNQVLTLNQCYIEKETITTGNGGSYKIENPKTEPSTIVFDLINTEFCPQSNYPPRTYPPEGCEIDMSKSKRTLRTKVIYCLGSTTVLSNV